MEVVNGSDPFDINFQDGLGFSALHYAVQRGSTDWYVLLHLSCWDVSDVNRPSVNHPARSLDHILETDGCDVDLQTRLDKSTPLHLAVQVEDPELRTYLGKSSSLLRDRTTNSSQLEHARAG